LQEAYCTAYKSTVAVGFFLAPSVRMSTEDDWADIQRLDKGKKNIFSTGAADVFFSALCLVPILWFIFGFQRKLPRFPFLVLQNYSF